MKINVVKSARVIVENPRGRNNYFGWPTGVRLKNGDIAVGSSGFRLGHLDPFGKACLSISQDEGETYSFPTPILDTVLDDRDVGLCPFGESGLILTTFNVPNSSMKEWSATHKDVDDEKIQAYMKGYMNTITDEEEKAAIGSWFRVSFDNGRTFGTPYKSPITSPHGPIELQNGKILWVGNYHYPDQKNENFSAAAYYINPHDGTMEKIGVIPDFSYDGEEVGLCEIGLRQLRDGRIIAHIRNNRRFNIYQVVSFDDGRTWTDPKQILPNYGGAPSHMLEMPDGTIVATYGYRSTKPYCLKVMFSKDKGETWDTGYHLYENNFSPDLAYPSSLLLKNGNILTVFYARAQETPPSVVWQIEWNFSE
jgi:hypothetical protein